MGFFHSNLGPTFTVVKPKGFTATQSSSLSSLWHHISTRTGVPHGYMVNEKLSWAPNHMNMKKKSSFHPSNANQVPRGLPNESLEYL